MDELLFEYTKRQAFLFVIFLLTYEISTYIANDMIMPGMIDVVQSFNAPGTMVSASLTAYIFGGASLQIFLGPISDRFGRRPVMLAGALLFLICTIFIALSQTIHQFILARFFQGMGLCFISVIGYATLQEIFTELYAVRLIAIMNNITIIAPLAGPLLGSLVIHFFSWRAVFHIIAFFATLALAGIWLYMPETVGKHRKDGTFNPHTSLAINVVSQNYIALIKNRHFICGAFAIGFLSIPVIAWIGTSPLILIKEAHLSVIEYGLWQLPIFFFSVIGNFAMRICTYRMSLHKISDIGSIITIISLFLTAMLPLLMQQHYLSLVIGLTLYSLGLGFTSASINRITLFSTIVPKGTASALISIVLMLLTGTGNQLAGYIYIFHNNFYFGLFCFVSGIIYMLFYLGMRLV